MRQSIEPAGASPKPNGNISHRSVQEPLRNPVGLFFRTPHAVGDTRSAPDAVGLAQGLVDRPGTTSARREVRRVARREFVAAAILSDEGRATANKMAELRIGDGAGEGAGRRFPRASLDGAVRRCIGPDAAKRRLRVVANRWRGKDFERAAFQVDWTLDMYDGHCHPRSRLTLELVMTSAETTTTLPWLTPALMALLLYGLGQGFVKMWIGEVSAARFCLYFACARALVMVSYFLAKLAYAADLGVLIASRYGRISLVTPLTGAYPVVTLAFAALVLQERIALLQWAASLHPGRDVLLHRLSASGRSESRTSCVPRGIRELFVTQSH